MLETLVIPSPKRQSAVTGWEGFFPYYAGYSERFARAVLANARLPKKAVVLDPWNGSGTTTYVASSLGLTSRGHDLNPVMVIVAKARLLPQSEAGSIDPLATELVKGSWPVQKYVDADDPLTCWFSSTTATQIRALEANIRRVLVGDVTQTASTTRLNSISGIAATFYVALFTVCRHLTASYRSSNPTWLRRPHHRESKVTISRRVLIDSFLEVAREMANALVASYPISERAASEITLLDTTSMSALPSSVDFILTSPPYCTRIDYTAATRIELALLAPFTQCPSEQLGRQMLGSTRVPKHAIAISRIWGDKCVSFLETLYKHSSKASSGYYFKTHLDYFDKMFRSLRNLSILLRRDGRAILVVQDSHYKEIHNDLPGIITEMAEGCNLALSRQWDFPLHRSMSKINRFTRLYGRTGSPTEAVLCFRKV